MPPLLSAIANAGRHGVLIKSAVVMELLADTSIVALDKTGTLTCGTPRLTAIESLFHDHRAARQARRVVIANLAIAAVFITVLVFWDLFGQLPLPLGVAGHEGSTVIVALNGLRLLTGRSWHSAAAGEHLGSSMRWAKSDYPRPHR